MQFSYVFKGSDGCMRTICTADVSQFLQHIETKFSDVLIPANQIATQEYIGKGCTYICMYTYIYVTVYSINTI